MPPRTAASRLARRTVDSASEDEFQRSDNDALLTPDSIENRAPRARAKPKATATTTTRTKAGAKVTKPKTTTTTTTKKGRTTDKTAPGRKREALAEKTNVNTEQEQEWESEEEERAPVKTKKKQAATKGKKSTVVKPAVKKEPEPEPEPESEAELSEEDIEQSIEVDVLPPTKNTEKTKKARRHEVEEVQPDTMDIDPTVFEDDEAEPELEPEQEPEPAPKSRRLNTSTRQVQHGSVSRQRVPQVSNRRRGASASDTERYGSVSDPTLRRQLGDKTRALESMTAKYNSLREQATKEAENNFDKLRRSTDERAKAQDDLIASLKRELSTQRSMQSDSKSLRAELTTLRNSEAKETSERKRLAEENRSVQASLSSAQKEIQALRNENRSLQNDTRNALSERSALQNEIKSLSAKLSAMRMTAAEAPKPTPAATRNQSKTAGNSEAVKDGQLYQLKEDLYSSLTGLIVLGIKKVEGEDVYDCIQTGRNRKQSDIDYNDVEFSYTPLLDENRDADLLDILPDYLTEEITFPRSSAAKFYGKVVDCMTKRIIVEE